MSKTEITATPGIPQIIIDARVRRSTGTCVPRPH